MRLAQPTSTLTSHMEGMNMDYIERVYATISPKSDEKTESSTKKKWICRMEKSDDD